MSPSGVDLSPSQALRTRGIDDVVRETVAQTDARQVILLGAGLDARALRMKEELLPGVVWYEVDHPLTQAAKRAKLEGCAAGVRFVAHDFCTCDDLCAKLAAAGFDPTAKSIVVWEGVMMYLPARAIEASVATLARVCAPGSVLVCHYWDAPAAQAQARRWPLSMWRFWPLMAWLAVKGEPLRFWGYPAGGMQAMLAQRGWGLTWERSAADVSALLNLPAATTACMVGGGWEGVEERLAVAVRA